ncbi:four-helix bundle copper-binding protein [Paenibacillus shunpengii]|uniref:Four-helix bundle copper-binding protein n=1 Tax=Paenibacillus shunpengii TaxID=2054424 RepID=A0ABW5SSH7_9BACL
MLRRSASADRDCPRACGKS